MDTATALTEGEFAAILRDGTAREFRFECQPVYAIGEERADFDAFLAGHPETPDTIGWWREWLDQVARLAAEGKTVGRVRILSEPPTAYQRWQLWAAPWHAAAGEDIRYLARGRAQALGLPLELDWWLLDDDRVILMQFTPDGEIGPKWIVEGPDVAPYLEWRDLAQRHAVPADRVAAA